MAGQVFAIASGKGGVGKTTTVVNLGVVLRRADHSVALVDADLGMANLGPMLGVSGELTLHDVLAGESTVEDALVEEAPGFAVLPGSDSLTDYPDADPKHLGAVLETLADSHDFVLVDTGAGMSHEDVLPLGLADHVVLVTSPDPAAMGDTRKTAELAGLAEGDIAGLVVTKADAGTDPTHVASQIGVDLLGVIPYDPTVRESTASGRPLEAIDPDTPAATAYRELANALADGSTDPLAETPAADRGAEPPATDDRTVDAGVEPDGDEPPEAVSQVDPDGSEGSEPADTTEAAEEPAAASADEEPSTPATETSLAAADDELLAERGDDEPDATPDEVEPSAVDSDDEADADDQAPDVASDDEADPTEEAEVEALADDEADPTEESEVEAAEDEESDSTEEPEVEAPKDEETEPIEEAEVEAAEDEEQTEPADEAEAEAPEDEEPVTDEAEDDEEDYLAEFEDDEPESKGGILSRIGRLFR